MRKKLFVIAFIVMLIPFDMMFYTGITSLLTEASTIANLVGWFTLILAVAVHVLMANLLFKYFK